jgi:hypothetical protein
MKKNNGFSFIESEDLFMCNDCGQKVQRGILNISGHWANCAGKETMDKVNKIDKMPLSLKDKMDIIKQVFKIEQ